MEPQRRRIAKAIWRRENKAEGITFTDCKLYYKAAVSKRHGTGIKNRHRD